MYKISWLFWFWQKCIMHNIRSIKEYFEYPQNIKFSISKKLFYFRFHTLSDLKSIRKQAREWREDVVLRHKERWKLKTNIFLARHTQQSKIYVKSIHILSRGQVHRNWFGVTLANKWGVKSSGFRHNKNTFLQET